MLLLVVFHWLASIERKPAVEKTKEKYREITPKTDLYAGVQIDQKRYGFWASNLPPPMKSLVVLLGVLTIALCALGSLGAPWYSHLLIAICVLVFGVALLLGKQKTHGTSKQKPELEGCKESLESSTS